MDENYVISVIVEAMELYLASILKGVMGCFVEL